MSNPLKSLFPSLLLLAAYFVADEFLGPLSRLCVIAGIGSAEFLYTRIREKRTDRLLLWMTFFFCLPDLAALWLGDSPLTRLQPALMETALCIVLGFLAFSRDDLNTLFPAAYRKNHPLSGQQQQGMRQLLKILLLLLTLHTAISYMALLTLPEATASLISGPLLYLLLGGFLLTLFLRSRLLLAKMKKEEWLPIVNEKGEVTGRAPRSLCHSGSMLLHPVVHLHILDEQKHIFLQKRSMHKDLLPGYWDTAVGGHIGLNEKVEEALKREAFEELGITRFEARFIGNYVWESPREKELVFSFLCTRYDHIRIDNDEVDEGRFWNKEQIGQGIRDRQITPNFAHEYQVLLSKIL